MNSIKSHLTIMCRDLCEKLPEGSYEWSLLRIKSRPFNYRDCSRLMPLLNIIPLWCAISPRIQLLNLFSVTVSPSNPRSYQIICSSANVVMVKSQTATILFLSFFLWLFSLWSQFLEVLISMSSHFVLTYSMAASSKDSTYMFVKCSHRSAAPLWIPVTGMRQPFILRCWFVQWILFCLLRARMLSWCHSKLFEV